VDKSRDAFRTISEVAEDLGVPQHVLRFWEGKFHQVKPMKRGGGRRYYRPGDVELLHGIKKLLYGDGFTIKGVQKILREQGLAYVQQAGKTGDEDSDRKDKKASPTKKQESAQAEKSKDTPAKEVAPAPEAKTTKPAEKSPPAAVSPPSAKPAPDSGKPDAGAGTGLAKEQIRLLKATLFELGEIKNLLQTAPDRRPRTSHGKNTAGDLA
jgi:DNA-binding transcriptional MerR regulator